MPPGDALEEELTLRRMKLDSGVKREVSIAISCPSRVRNVCDDIDGIDDDDNDDEEEDNIVEEEEEEATLAKQLEV
jgi:hypothetical protein